jgi:hypothetical protein
MAKDSLNQTHIFIPEERTFLPPVSVVLDHFPDGEHIYENNPLKLYQKTYLESGQNYHYKGNWHKYLLDDTIWQEPSLSVLHAKKETQGLRKFMVQILGRTLPTFHRLHKVRPRLYPNSNCELCGQATDESIEHLFFRRAESASRRSLLIDQCLLVISERQKTLIS